MAALPWASVVIRSGPRTLAVPAAVSRRLVGGKALAGACSSAGGSPNPRLPALPLPDVSCRVQLTWTTGSAPVQPHAAPGDGPGSQKRTDPVRWSAPGAVPGARLDEGPRRDSAAVTGPRILTGRDSPGLFGRAHGGPGKGSETRGPRQGTGDEVAEAVAAELRRDDTGPRAEACGSLLEAEQARKQVHSAWSLRRKLAWPVPWPQRSEATSDS